MESKKALDKIIGKSRVHFYKPIQIAEILYSHRTRAKLNILDLESYRNSSKRWRDEISRRLVGRVSTSSQKFQDNIFEENAMPPKFLHDLAEFNNKNKGLVEAYIYYHLKNKLSMVEELIAYLEKRRDRFKLDEFLSLVNTKPGLKRSIDKVYEISVYALFNAIVKALNISITLSVENFDSGIVSDFEDFIQKVLGITKNRTSLKSPASLFRVGSTNAADSGLDMWANFGPAIQIKHVSLTEEIAEEVAENVSADKIILVCLDAEAKVVDKILNQLPFRSRIQGIITVSDLMRWYSMSLSQKYTEKLGAHLIEYLIKEFKEEFPSSTQIQPFIRERDYSSNLLKGAWSVV